MTTSICSEEAFFAGGLEAGSAPSGEREGSGTLWVPLQLGGRSRSVGRATAGQVVKVVCDATTREWEVRVANAVEIKRLPIQGLDAATVTDIADVPIHDLPPLQLTLPLVA